MQKKLTPEEFRKMQLIQLDMLVEFDRVCRKYSIPYTIFGGTLLGAVRHKGYIPWDDDADIALLREDYEKFKSVCNEMNPEICFFQDHETEHEYLWGYGKIRRTGTVYIRDGQEHLKHKTGFFIDVFPMDDIPLSTTGQIIQDIYCYFLRKILWSQVACKNSKGLTKIIQTCISHISPEKVYKCVHKMSSKSKNDSPNRVRLLLYKATGKLYRKNSLKTRFGMPKSWFLERAEYDFEGYKFFGAKDYDAVLKYIFNDYMTLPPEEKRIMHAPVSSYDFGTL